MHRYIFSLFLFAAASASAQTLTLADIAPRVRSQHPSLRAARLAIDEARARQLGAGKLSNPTLGMELQNESQVSPGSLGLSIDQSFPITQRLALEKKLSAQLVEAAELEVRDAARSLIAEAQSLAVKLLALEKHKALRKQQIVLAEKLSQFVSDRAKAGELSALDAAQIAVDEQRLRLDARKLANETTNLLSTLRPLLGLPPGASLQVTGELPAPAVPADTSSWKQRADYQLAQKKTDAARTELDLAKANRLGDMSAGLFTAREWQKVGGEREGTGFIGLRLSVPWPLWNKNEGEIAEKTVSTQRTLLEADALAARISNEVDTAHREMSAHADLLRETKDKLLPMLAEHTTKLEKAYESGQTDLITLQRARDQQLQLEAVAIDAQRDFHLARIRYEAATGKHAPAEPTTPSTRGK